MIAHNLQTIRKKISETAAKAGRQTDSIKLVAVSKRQPVSAIAEAFAAGQTLFGENYVQELQDKRAQLPVGVNFHFIGHLQTNKVKIAARCSHMIETVDRYKVAVALNKQLTDENRRLDILIQVNIGNDPKKSGTTAQEAGGLLKQVSALPQLRICGLMTMPPYNDDPEEMRPYFRNLRALAEQFQGEGLFPGIERPELSMGMSHDFQVAIEEGATIVRVGTAIFGERK
jgi:pyridoxal phosphate enzyme (YggS family)